MIKELFNKSESEIYDYNEEFQEKILETFDGVPVGETDIELLKWYRMEDSLNSERDDVDKFLGVLYDRA